MSKQIKTITQPWYVWFPDLRVPDGLTIEDLASAADLISAWSNEGEFSAIPVAAKVYEFLAAARARNSKRGLSGDSRTLSQIKVLYALLERLDDLMKDGKIIWETYDFGRRMAICIIDMNDENKKQTVSLSLNGYEEEITDAAKELRNGIFMRTLIDS